MLDFIHGNWQAQGNEPRGFISPLPFPGEVFQLSERHGCSNSSYPTKNPHNSVTDEKLISIKIISLASLKYTELKVNSAQAGEVFNRRLSSGSFKFITEHKALKYLCAF